MIDLVIGLQYGDEGKGKVVNHLANTNKYDFCMRYNGGANAGHTIYHNGKKLVTHQVPSGIVHNIQCVIGDNCYVDINKLKDEIKYLSDNGVPIIHIYLSENAHIITEEHLSYDSNDTKIGTTKSGIGPCASSKYMRTGKRVKDLMTEETNIFGNRIIPINIYSLIKTHYNSTKKYPRILVEGAQGFGLDITHGDYPFVTSSHCIATDFFNMGIPFINNQINIYGVCKCYETYVGNKIFQDYNDNILKTIQEKGNEKGATTGRDRQVNYLRLDYLCKSLWINNTTKIVINKYDILEQVGVFRLYINNELKSFDSLHDFKSFVNRYIISNIPWINEKDIYWSGNIYSIN